MTSSQQLFSSSSQWLPTNQTYQDPDSNKLKEKNPHIVLTRQLESLNTDLIFNNEDYYYLGGMVIIYEYKIILIF